MLAFVLLGTVSYSQNELEWSSLKKLQLSDFQSSTTKIGDVNIYSLHSGVTMNFAYQMSSAQFMFKKNFNSAAKCIFSYKAASLLAPDSATAFNLVDLAQFEFDLTELYTRKFRKRLFEEKGTFSGGDFYQPIYNRVQAELNERLTTAGIQTELGQNKKELETLHKRVLLELEEYSDYCYSCNPPKKNKKKNKKK